MMPQMVGEHFRGRERTNSQNAFFLSGLITSRGLALLRFLASPVLVVVAAKKEDMA